MDRTIKVRTLRCKDTERERERERERDGGGGERTNIEKACTYKRQSKDER